jgi:hypothetical protein
VSVNLSVEAPDFDYIKKEAGTHTADAIRLLWAVANDEAGSRRTGLRIATERIAPKSVIDSPGGAQNDYDTQFGAILRFDGAVAFNLTGLKARTDNTVMIIIVLGAGTVTVKHNSAASETVNRILLAGAADKAVATNKALILVYENTRWREVSLA